MRRKVIRYIGVPAPVAHPTNQRRQHHRCIFVPALTPIPQPIQDLPKGFRRCPTRCTPSMIATFYRRPCPSLISALFSRRLAVRAAPRPIPPRRIFDRRLAVATRPVAVRALRQLRKRLVKPGWSTHVPSFPAASVTLRRASRRAFQRSVPQSRQYPRSGCLPPSNHSANACFAQPDARHTN